MICASLISEDPSFNRSESAELPHEMEEIFWVTALTLADSRQKLDTWCRYCHEDTPHPVIGFKASIPRPRLPRHSDQSNSRMAPVFGN